MCVCVSVCACAEQCIATECHAPGMAWISFRKVSKVYTLFALISMFIRQRKIAGRDHGGGRRRRGGGCEEVGYLKHQ